MPNLTLRSVLIVLILIGLSSAAVACPVCYGSDETSSAGINLAIMTLLGITGSVLGAIVAFAVYMKKRANVTLSGDLDLPSLN